MYICIMTIILSRAMGWCEEWGGDYSSTIVATGINKQIFAQVDTQNNVLRDMYGTMIVIVIVL